MRDSSRKPEDLNPLLKEIWDDSKAEFATTYPMLAQPFLTQTFRNDEDQEILYMMSRNGKDDDGDGKIDESDEWRSNARPGESKHNVYPSNALDVAFKQPSGRLDWSNDLFDKLAAIMIRRGAKWGGNFKKNKDRPHFEL